MKDLAGLGHLFACIFLLNFSLFIVVPAITDVTMAALCPGQDECSLAIYLSGFQQAVTGIGTLVVTPLVGFLSDKYGRKALLTVPMTIGIIPVVILAYDRSKMYFYAYYAIKMFTGMFCEGSVLCLSLAYVADQVGERRRASAFGVLSGISAAGFVSGTVAARFLSTASTFKVSATVGVVAAIYMRLCLAETGGGSVVADEASRPLCCDGEASPKLPLLRKVPSPAGMVSLLRSSLTLSRAAFVAFFHSLGESGLQASLLIVLFLNINCSKIFELLIPKEYYLKAQFHFNKDQFADLLLIVGIAGVFSQLFLMPLLVPTMGEDKLLSIGLLASCTNVFLYSIAWSAWVPYFISTLVVISVFVQPCLRSIVSRKVGLDEQGMAQGCVTGISSFASVISPFIFTPLAALFLSENAPFDFKGFSIMCSGFAMLTAFMLSILMRTATSVSSQKLSNIGHEQV